MGTKTKTYYVQSAIIKEGERAKKRTCFALKGFFFAFMSAIFHVLAGIIVKRLQNLHPAQCTFYRFIASFVISLPGIVKCGQNPFGPRRFRLILLCSGIFGGLSAFLCFLAYKYLPLAESFVIFASAPVFVTAAACLFLNELCDSFQVIFLILTITGIVFVTKLPSHIAEGGTSYTIENIYGFVAAILSTLTATSQIIFLRVVKSVPHSTAIFTSSLIGLVECLLLPFFIDLKWHRCGIQWLEIVLIGFLSFLQQTLLKIALQCEFASLVVTVRCSFMITTAIAVQTLIYHDIIDSSFVIGTTLVIFSNASLGVRKWITSKP